MNCQILANDNKITEAQFYDRKYTSSVTKQDHSRQAKDKCDTTGKARI